MSIIKRVFGWALTLSVIAAGACKNELNLEPKQSLSPGQALNSLENLESILIGGYSRLRDVSYYGRNFVITPDVSGDDLVNTLASNRFVSSYTYERRAEDGFASGMWTTMYQAINSCNYILDFVGDVEGDAARKRGLMAQALALRGLVYFDLVRTFAQPYQVGNGGNLGVPLVLQDSLTGSAQTVVFPARATVAEVYNQIVSDFQEAVTLFSSSSQVIITEPGKGLIDRNTARALLARVKLYRQGSGDLEDVVAQSTAVISSGKYELISKDDYLGAWTRNNDKEALFHVTFVDDNNNGSNNLGRMYLEAGYGDLRPRSQFIDLFEIGDVRRQFFVANQSGEIFINKYPGINGILGMVSPRVVRLAEVYLNRAEANARLGNFTEARTDLAVIQRRAYGDRYTPPTLSDSEVLDAILLERRKELFAEGHRAFDIFRTNGEVNREGIYAGNNGPVRTGDWNAIWGIPQVEIDVNGNLVQNPRY
ncbi:MAG: RagB/SusD family nutrient uptake outer membrane protein [Cytophagales bacterium]|nr:RagB/SusD family nutrient uptake outer membrane protein [Cytophagales bacterium]